MKIVFTPDTQEDYRARLTSQQTTPTVKAIRALMMNDTRDLDVVAFQVSSRCFKVKFDQNPQVHYPSFDFIQTVQHATVTKKSDR